MQEEVIEMKQSVAVIGGGIVGLATGYYLARDKEWTVSLFDKDKGQATKASGGIIAPWLSQRRNQDWYALVKEAAAFYPQFIRDLGEDPEHSELYQQNGALILKKKEKTLEKVYQIGLERRQDAPEMGDIKILSPEQIQEKFPIYDSKGSAIFVEGGARADGQAMVKAIRRKLADLSCSIVDENVDHIHPDERGYTLQAGDQTYRFDRIVLANGAWLAELLTPLGFQVDTGPQKGQLAEVFLEDCQSKDWPVVMPAGGNNVIPFAGGRILVGATHEKEDGFDTTLIPERVQPLLEDAAEQISKQFLQADHINYRVGIRAYSSDFSPYFGEIDQLKGVYVANGLGATGLTAGPLIGYMLVRLLKGQDIPLPLDPYQPSHYIQKED